MPSPSRLQRLLTPTLPALLLLALLLLALAPSPALSQIQPNYNTAPEIWYTFDRAPNGTTRYRWIAGSSDHSGVAVFNGSGGSYLDLRATADDNGRYIPLALPLTFSLEYWVYWPATTWASWMRLFECGDGTDAHSLNLANFERTGRLAFGVNRVVNGTTTVNTRTVTAATQVLPTKAWVHVAVSLEQHTRTDRERGLMSLYIDGARVATNNNSWLVNPAVLRTGCWIGRSLYNPPVGGDAWLDAQIDDFFYYTYPLSQEAILAHLRVPRPPVYELTFSNNPQLASPTPLSAWNYTWSDQAEGDARSADPTQNHDGHLLLDGDQFIDMAVVQGPASVYAQPIPRIGNYAATGAHGTMRPGYSIEVMFKALTLNERYAKIYDIGSGPTSNRTIDGTDNILLGYVEATSQLRFEWFIGTQSPADSQKLIVVDRLQRDQWYHVVVVMTPSSLQSTNGSVTAYVNGVRARNVATNVPLPRNVARQHAYVGKSHWAADQYFDMYLDAFRLFDFSLSAAEVAGLYGSTTEVLPPSGGDDAGGYHTGPIAQFTFNSAPAAPAPYTWANPSQPLNEHYGVARFNTLNQTQRQYVDLATFRQPSGGASGEPMSLRFGGSMTFETWVRFRTLRRYSRIFDFAATYASPPNSIYLFNVDNSADLVFETYVGEHKSLVRLNGALRVGQWQHIVAVVQQNTVNDTSSEVAATYKIYIDGKLAAEALGSLPLVHDHASSFLGRSNYAADEYLEGDIDAFYVYDYAMQYEQVAAHYILPRPPVFELAFVRDPRPWLQAGSLDEYTYTWDEFDTSDGQTNAGGYHNGFLVLSGDQWVNLTAPDGLSSVGTTLPPELFYPMSRTQGNAGGEVYPASPYNYGWSIELLVKLMTVESNATIFDFGSPAVDNTVSLGYAGEERALYFNVAGQAPTELQVLTNVLTGVSYHIVIVMTASGTNNLMSVTAWVDGVQGQTQTLRSAPVRGARTDAFLGKSRREGAEYFDMRLDTFRIYDYALREVAATPAQRVISNLYNLTSAVLPQLVTPVYYTQPLAQYTFDAPADDSSTLTTFTWLAADPASPAHTGVARFNGADEWVDLMTFLDDTGAPFPALVGNGSMSFEAWVKYERLQRWSRVFDFGSGVGEDKDNILLASYMNTSRVAAAYFPADSASGDYTELASTGVVNTTWVVGRWQHVVVTVEDRVRLNASAVRNGPRGNDAALWTVYLQGNVVIQSTGYMPRAVPRPAAFLAKSGYARDELFAGMIDSFYYYNYALSAEQINAHIALPRPPVFDLSFSTDPRLLLPDQPDTYNYQWQEFDPRDSFSNTSRFHSGHLVLSAAQGNYVNLSTPSGPNSVGIVLPRIGGRRQAISGTSVGWSLEGVVKVDTQAVWAKLLDWGNGPRQDNIAIGYQNLSNRLLLQVYNGLIGNGNYSSVPIIANVTLGRWYHFVAVLVPRQATGWDAIATVYVDGVQTVTVNNAYLPQSVERRSALLGRSNFNDSDALFSAKIDAIRVYDYAITPQMALSLYRLAHDPGFVPQPPPPQSSTGGSGGTGGPRPSSGAASSTVRRNTSSSSSSSRIIIGPTSSSVGECQYGRWPNCECRCDSPGYVWPNCRPCPGEEPPVASAAPVDVGLVVVVIVCVVVAACIGVGVYVYWKNKRGRVTYSLDGGFGDSGTDGGSDGSEWVPGGKRGGKAGGGGGLLGNSSDSSSEYDWQAYRNAPSGRTDVNSWSSQ